MKNLNQSLKSNKSSLAYVILIFFLLVILFPKQEMYSALAFFGITGVFLSYKTLVSKGELIKINTVTIFLFTFFYISLVSSLISDSFNSFSGTTKLFLLELLVSIIIYLLLINGNHNMKKITKVLIVGCLFLSLGSILQLFRPDLLININEILMSPEHFSESSNFINRGILSGFFFNPAYNGFIISIIILFLYISIYFSTKVINKSIMIIMILLYIYFLLLTGKRGFVVFVLVIILYLTYKLSRNKLKSVLIILILSLIFGYLIFNTEAGFSLIERSLRQDDITSGRGRAYRIMIEDFQKNPLFGLGTYTTSARVGLNNGHNIYFQVLRENGLVGIITFILLLTINLMYTNIAIKYSEQKDNKFSSFFSMSIQLLFIFWGVTGNPLYDYYAFLIYIVATAVSYRLSREELKTRYKSFIE